MIDLSLIVPTRQRPRQLARFLASIADTCARPESLEVVLVIDADDAESRAVADARLSLHHVIVPPGQTMGSLNSAGYEAARGRWLMLLNDDVEVRTPGWDDIVRTCTRAFPDEIALLHVNDLVFQTHLCTFPIVSRRFCAIVGGVCPREYVRYRIDDHIEDHFNLLAALGERRTIYLPDVVFEHHNYRTNAAGLRQYFSQPKLLEVDAATFQTLFEQRKRQALALMARIRGQGSIPKRWRRRLISIMDPFALRTPHRQWWWSAEGLVDRSREAPSTWQKFRTCMRERGWRGLARALYRRVPWYSATP